MRWVVLVVLVACRREPEAPRQRGCWETCYAECNEPIRSELYPCAQRCSEACTCRAGDDACSCAWRGAMYGAAVPAHCIAITTLDFAPPSDAAIQDAPHR